MTHITATTVVVIAALALVAFLVYRSQRRSGYKASSWKRGVTTYYSASSSARGASGKRLTAFKSVAVPIKYFKAYRGRRVMIKGFGTYVVEDACVGGGCKNFDIYVGTNAGNARRLPGWQKGNIPIQYRWA